mgnify:CR=1 FL=1
MNLDEKQEISLKEALKREGSFLRDKLVASLARNETIQVIGTEFPVVYGESQRKIDLVLKTRGSFKKGLATNPFRSFEIYFIIEIKKWDSEKSGVICFGEHEERDYFGVSLVGSNLDENYSKNIQKKFFTCEEKLNIFTDFHKFDEIIVNKQKGYEKKFDNPSELILDKDQRNYLVLRQIFEETA